MNDAEWEGLRIKEPSIIFLSLALQSWAGYTASQAGHAQESAWCLQSTILLLVVTASHLSLWESHIMHANLRLWLPGQLGASTPQPQEGSFKPKPRLCDSRPALPFRQIPMNHFSEIPGLH